MSRVGWGVWRFRILPMVNSLEDEDETGAVPVPVESLPLPFPDALPGAVAPFFPLAFPSLSLSLSLSP